MLKIWIFGIYKKNEYWQFSRIWFDYIKQIESTGIALPIIIPCNTKYIEKHIDFCDAFIFPGWDDIDPEVYGHENNGSENFHKNNDDFLLNCLDTIIRKKKPIFWICKWMQLINVYFWGTLVQNIPENKLHYDLTKQESEVHEVFFEKSSFLGKAFDTENIWVNSIHHQVIENLWEWLEIVAKSKEGYAEAITHTKHKIYWVQWHPEMMKKHAALFKYILEDFQNTKS
jgi:putative glutamine amidotransferase